VSPGLAYALIWTGFVAYLGVVAIAPALGRRLLWTTIVVLLAGFAAAPVLLSHDVYSYVDYARLGVVHGLDPYVHPPAAAPADPAFADVTWTDATSAYGPLFTLATYPLAWLPVGAAVAVLKVASGAVVLALAALVGRLASLRGIDPLRATAFVALNPLVLVHVVGGAHNDGLAMLLAIAGVAAVLSAREASGGVALVAAFAVKTPAALAAPFAFANAARTRHSPHQSEVEIGWATRRDIVWLTLGAVAAAVAIGLSASFAFGWHWLDALGLAGENQHRTSYMSVPITAARLTGLDPTAVRAAAFAAYALLFAYLLLRTWQGADWLRCAAWASLGLLLATAWLLPWYLIWTLPLAALSRDRPLQLLVLALTAEQLGARIPL
jgi:alpha-1,6-mannosyltransferase